jgi:uncharacterized protein YaaQ
MNLTIAIVSDNDADKVVDALVAHGFYVTRLASTGSFLSMGNTVLLSDVEDDQFDQIKRNLK